MNNCFELCDNLVLVTNICQQYYIVLECRVHELKDVVRVGVVSAAEPCTQEGLRNDHKGFLRHH